jgi:hypothetical protein
MLHPLNTPPTDDTPYIDAYTSILAALVRPGADLRVTAWILESMADTFALLAFAQACDELDSARMPHPNAPGPGQEYALPEVPPALRAECQRAAVLLYAAILAAPGGYDPAPALVRWYAAGNSVSDHWEDKVRDAVLLSEAGTEAAARCWGHYAVVEAVGHGVAWSDDNEPLRSASPVFDPGGCRYCGSPTIDGRHGWGWSNCRNRDPEREIPPAEGTPLPSVGDLGVTADVPTWEDEYTRAAWEKMDEAERRHSERVERVEE